MMRLSGEDRFQNLATLALVGKSLVGLGSSNRQSQRVKNRCLIILRIGCLESAHLLFKGLAVRIGVLTVFAVNFSQCVDVGILALCSLRVAGGDLLRLVQSNTARRRISV